MPLRNPFKRTGPSELSVSDAIDGRLSSASITGAQPIDEQVALEHELSEINNSGVFLPPSANDSGKKPSFWPTKSTSSFSSNPRSILSDTEPFNMSRESFDSFRRSFDISARSPVLCGHEPDARRSLDSSLLLSPAVRTSLSERLQTERADDDDELEDVGLADDASSKQPAAPRRRGLFARFTESNERPLASEVRERELGIKPSHSFQLFSGRKRGQSGLGDELASISRTGTLTISVGGE